MKIRGTKQEIEFLEELIYTNEVTCDKCPYTDECKRNIVCCSEIIMKNLVQEPTEVLMVYWNKRFGKYSTVRFHNLEQLKLYISKYEIMKEDILEVLEIDKSNDLRNKI